MSNRNGWNEEQEGECSAAEPICADEMNRYVCGRSTEQERAKVEQRLADCGHCLQLFMAELELMEAEWNNGMAHAKYETQLAFPDMQRIEERVVSQLLRVGKPEQRPFLISLETNKTITAIAAQEKPYRRSNWLQHPVTQYTIAASITLLLLASGTFASFSQKLAELDLEVEAGAEQHTLQPHPSISAVPADKPSESWSEKMVNQTGSWLDGLQAIRFK
ncbi:hypothetical protein L1N85_22590 [Paenibacillus alkaliterrae]|uniref:hypothetical protein n=1 Tax=Paenibacillus alkaliterrae TaxID=320909 RepID=UPI001F268ED3|nr:hypothetical protein [Paenibacillus alkaliterrae]MCF2941163.1 hypothetical protein [Paenibacillus alkaliterrae]